VDLQDRSNQRAPKEIAAPQKAMEFAGRSMRTAMCTRTEARSKVGANTWEMGDNCHSGPNDFVGGVVVYLSEKWKSELEQF